jgi:CheY-like chemotaxis protein
MPAEEIITGGLFTILSRSMPKRIRIETSFTPLPAPVHVDPAQIVQAMVNVCTNAKESMPDGGVLRIGIHEAACPGHVRARFADAPESFCAITISDTGAGMPREAVTKIFEPFFTTKDMGQGTGLGMSITHSIIRNHDGHIEVSSNPGQGTTVTIYLPFAAEEPGREDASAPDAARQGTPGVLVVDDDIDVLDVTVDILQSEGYRVFTAPGGEQAIKAYNANRGEIDLVLLDIIMPDRDGREVFADLKKLDPGCRVLLYSGYSLDGQAEELLNDPCIHGYLQKPFKMADLVANVRRIAGPGRDENPQA